MLQYYTHWGGWFACVGSSLPATTAVTAALRDAAQRHHNGDTAGVEIAGGERELGGEQELGVQIAGSERELRFKTADEGLCLWAAAANLINIVDPATAAAFYQRRKAGAKFSEVADHIFSWECRKMSVTAAGDWERGHMLLQRVLQVSAHAFNCTHVPPCYCIVAKFVANGCCRSLPQMTTGKVIAKLMNSDGTGLHVVGIDLDNSTVYDCAESFVLPFTPSVLDRCTGQLSRCTGISAARQLVPPRRGKKRKKARWRDN
eukprot:COSAG01_NODE_5449_length_4258_cov_2.190430_3_plen_260_part_00